MPLSRSLWAGIGIPSRWLPSSVVFMILPFLAGSVFHGGGELEMGLTDQVTLAEEDRTRKEKREGIQYSVMIRERERGREGGRERERERERERGS